MVISLFKVWGSEVQGSGFKVQGSKVQGSKVQGSEIQRFRVRGSKFSASEVLSFALRASHFAKASRRRDRGRAGLIGNVSKGLGHFYSRFALIFYLYPFTFNLCP